MGEEFGRTGDRGLESLRSRCFLLGTEEVSRDDLVTTDFLVGSLGCRRALAASVLNASPEASCAKSQQMLMELTSLSFML